MPGELPFPAETVLEGLFQQGFLIRHRHEAVPQVARRDDAHFLTEPSRRAAVVSDRHHGGEVGRFRLQPAEKHGQAVTAADSRHSRPVGQDDPVHDLLGNARFFRHEKGDDAFCQLPHGHEHARRPDEDGHNAAQRDDGVIVLPRQLIGKEEYLLFDDAQELVVQDERHSENERDQPRREEEHPPLDPQSRIEPAHEAFHDSSSTMS